MASAFAILLVSALSSLVVATDWSSFKKSHVLLSPTIPRIIGGEVAAPHAYPFMVGLLINGNSFCGGSLISENYVLTAAHCGIVVSSVEVILGAHNVTSEETTQTRILGGAVTVHEDFNFTSYQNDIAIIRLSEPATLSDEVQLVTLPSRSDDDKEYVDETVVSIGWGLSHDVPQATIRDLSDDLRYVNVSVMSLGECGDFFNDYDRGLTYVSEYNLCTSGHQNRGTCNGDSGGPLLYNGVQIGLVSIGTNLCEVCSPSIFTKVPKYLDWIEEHSDVVIH